MLFLQLRDASLEPLFCGEVGGSAMWGRGWKELVVILSLPHTSWVTLDKSFHCSSVCI